MIISKKTSNKVIEGYKIGYMIDNLKYLWKSENANEVLLRTYLQESIAQVLCQIVKRESKYEGRASGKFGIESELDISVVMQGCDAKSGYAGPESKTRGEYIVYYYYILSLFKVRHQEHIAGIKLGEAAYECVYMKFAHEYMKAQILDYMQEKLCEIDEDVVSSADCQKLMEYLEELDSTEYRGAFKAFRKALLPIKNVTIIYRYPTGRFLARIISDKLEAEGYRTFYAEGCSGDFDVQVYDEIDESSCIIIVLTHDIFNSFSQTDDWVRLQLLYAKENRKRVIPIQLPDFIYPLYVSGVIDNIGKLRQIRIDSEDMGQQAFDDLIEYIEI